MQKALDKMQKLIIKFKIKIINSEINWKKQRPNQNGQIEYYYKYIFFKYDWNKIFLILILRIKEKI